MKKTLLLLSFITLSTASFFTQAIIITAAASLEQNTITIDYTFQGTSQNVESFDLFFDLTLFDNLAVKASPLMSDWDTEVFQSIPDFAEDGLINFLSFAGPLFDGDILSGFQISADFIGALVPDAFTQAFQVVDPNTFQPIGNSQQTQAIAITVTQVNAPLTTAMLMLGVSVLFVRRKFK